MWDRSSPIKAVSNYDFVKENENLFWKIYKEEFWKDKVSRKVLDLEIERLRNILKWSFSSKLNLPEWKIEEEKEKFVKRILAGFVLDGLFLKEKFPSKILVELESPGVIAVQKSLWDFKSIKI